MESMQSNLKSYHRYHAGMKSHSKTFSDKALIEQDD